MTQDISAEFERIKARWVGNINLSNQQNEDMIWLIAEVETLRKWLIGTPDIPIEIDTQEMTRR